MISWPVLDKPITWDEISVPVLVIENKLSLRSFLETALAETGGSDGSLILSDETKMLDLAKSAEVITNPYSLDFSTRTLSTKINTAAAEAGEDLADEMYAVVAQINEIASKISLRMDYDITYTELDNFTELLKLMKFHSDAGEYNLPERLLEYMLLSRGLLGKKLFIVYGLCALLEEKEIELFLHELLNRKLKVLLIEASQPATASEMQMIVVDHDLCVLR